MVRLPPRLRPLFPHLKAAYTTATRVAAPVSVQLSGLRGGYLPTGVVATMEEAARTGGGQFWEIRPEEVVERTVPVGTPPGHAAFADNVREVVERVGIVELPDGRVLGPQRAVITGSGDLLHELSAYFGTTRPREHPLYLHPFPSAPQRVEGRLGVLASRGDANYYHFLMDVLPRLRVVEQCREMEPPERWYVPCSTSFQRDLLDRVGIPPEQRIDADEKAHVQADTLVVPGLPATVVKNPAWAVRFLRERLLPAGLDRVPGRRLYVTRGSERNNRIVLDEDDLVDDLATRGFRRIDPGRMTVDEQIRSFAEADVIVAPHGAALANLAFASPGCTLIELFPEGHIVPDYWKLSGGVPGLDYRYLAGLGATAQCDRTQMLITDIEVDRPALFRLLDTV